MPAFDLRLQHELVPRPGDVERNEPGRGAVDEHHQRRRRVVRDAGERDEIGAIVHDEGVLERHADRKGFAETGGATGEDRHAARVRPLRLLDQRTPARLDPREVVRIGATGVTRALQLGFQENAHALPLMLVRPPRVQIDADHRARRLQLRQLCQTRSQIHGVVTPFRTSAPARRP